MINSLVSFSCRIMAKCRNILFARTIWRRHQFGSNFHAGRGVVLWAKTKLVIGDNFYIGRYSQIECDADIGNDVILANCVALVGRYDHHFQCIGVPTRLAPQIRDRKYNWKGLKSKVVIGDDVWIGYGSIILSGSVIGNGSIVAAGSVVSKDVPPYTIVAGNPATFVKNRFNSQSEQDEHVKQYYDIRNKATTD